MNLTEKYNSIIQEQLKEGIIERVPPQPIQPASEGAPLQPVQPTSEGVQLQPIPLASEGVALPQNPTTKSREFYLPHKYVLRETAQTTKIRIVYDASARPTPEAPSLNDCLYTGPTLQNKLWDVLVQQRIYPVIVSGDIKQAFLQIRVKQSERDTLRFHWRSDAEARIETCRFTRVLFGLAPSPFLLGGVIESHLDAWSTKYPDEVERLCHSFYVDDLLTGGGNVTEARKRKALATEIMADGKFTLHKWHSNVTKLKEIPASRTTEDQTYYNNYKSR